MRHPAPFSLVSLLALSLGGLISCGATSGSTAADGPGPSAPAAGGPEPASASSSPTTQAHASEPQGAEKDSAVASSSGDGAAPPAAGAGAAESAAALPLPSGTKVLHIGDSFAGALGLPLGKLLEEDGVRSVLQHTDSSYLTDWAWDGKLQQFIYKYNPDLVIVTLGANELAIGEPEQREKTVKKIVATIGDRPCVWVAIPLWSEKHNGLLDVIKKSSSPCVYYDTNRLIDVAHMPRIHDGIHPTKEARTAWAATFFGWLTEHRDQKAKEPLRMLP